MASSLSLSIAGGDLVLPAICHQNHWHPCAAAISSVFYLPKMLLKIIFCKNTENDFYFYSLS